MFPRLQQKCLARLAKDIERWARHIAAFLQKNREVVGVEQRATTGTPSLTLFGFLGFTCLISRHLQFPGHMAGVVCISSLYCTSDIVGFILLFHIIISNFPFFEGLFFSTELLFFVFCIIFIGIYFEISVWTGFQFSECFASCRVQLSLQIQTIEFGLVLPLYEWLQGVVQWIAGRVV